jgi:hypothetical protein
MIWATQSIWLSWRSFDGCHGSLRDSKSKCEFFKEKITFCGYDINSEGLHKSPTRQLQWWMPLVHRVLHRYAASWNWWIITTNSCQTLLQSCIHWTKCWKLTTNGTGKINAKKLSANLKQWLLPIWYLHIMILTFPYKWHVMLRLLESGP